MTTYIYTLSVYNVIPVGNDNNCSQSVESFQQGYDVGYDDIGSELHCPDFTRLECACRYFVICIIVQANVHKTVRIAIKR